MDNQPQEQSRPEWEIAWNAMQQSPEFQAADDKEREQMRNSVYHDYIENRLPTRLKQKAKDRFDELTKPEGDPDSGILNDLFSMAGAGAVSATSDLAAAFTGGTPNVASKWLTEQAEGLTHQASPSAITGAQNFGIEYDPDTGLKFSEGSTPYGALMAATQGGGSLLPMFAGGLAGRAVGTGLRALSGVQKAGKAAVAAGNMEKAIQAMNTGDRIMKASVTGSYGATMGGMIGGGTGQQAYQEVMAAKPEQIRQSPQYQNYIDQGLTPDQAREQLATDAARSQFLPAAGLGIASGMIAGPALEKLVRGGASASRLMNVGRGVATELPQEMLESGGQQYLSNVAQKEVGLDVDPMAGVINQTLTGGVLGGMVGGALGAASKPNKPPTQDKTETDLNEANIEVQRLEAELKQADLPDAERATAEAQLEKAYRRVVDLEAVKTTLQEETEEKEKAATKAPESKPPEPEAKPPAIDANAPWVATDIDNQITDLSRDIRQQESNFRRTLQNGGKEEDAGILEREMGKQKALLNRLQALSKHRDKQSLFDKKEDFYSWIDLTTGTPDEQVEAGQWLRDRQQHQQARLGVERVLRDEAYQEMAKTLPSHEDIKHELKQIKRKELAHRVTASGAHRDPFRWKRRKEHREREAKRNRAVPEAIAGYHTETTPKDFLVRSGQENLKKFGPQGLGGIYDRRRGGWVFPRQRRATVAKALEQWQPRPSGQPAPRKPRYSTERISNLTNKPAKPATVTPIEEARAKAETPTAPVVELKPKPKPKQEKPVEPVVEKEKPATKEPPPVESPTVEKKELAEKKATPKPEEPPAPEPITEKPKKSSVAKVTHTNLKDKDVIGNDKGQPWNKRYQAESALKRKNLESTHYVSGDKNFLLKKTPDLSKIEWGYYEYEDSDGAIQSVMVPKSPVPDVSALEDITGEKFVKHRKWGAPFEGDTTDIKDGTLVIRPAYGRRDEFLKKLADTAPKQQPAAETKPREPAPETNITREITGTKAPDYEAREQVKQQMAANLRQKFKDQYAGNKGDAPQPFVDSLLHNDFEKALDDVHRERLTPDTAIATANKAVEAGAMDRESADRFVKKLKEQVPEKPEPEAKPEPKTETASKYIPPTSEKDVSEAWKRRYHDDFEPTPSQKKLMTVVGEALDKGLIYNNDVYDFVKEALSSDLKGYDFSIGKQEVERGAFGYDIYHARQAEESRRSKEQNQKNIQQFKEGQTFKKIEIWIGHDKHKFSSMEIESIDGKAGTINLKAKKRGSSKQFNVTLSANSLVHALETKEKREAKTETESRVKTPAEKPAAKPEPEKAKAIVGYSDQHPKWASDHEKDVVGGKVIYSDDRQALLEGYSVQTGKPVYSVIIKGVGRSSVDVSHFTGKQLSPEDKQQLIRIKEQHTQKEQALHEAHPEGPFKKGEQVSTGEGIKPSVATVAKNWLKMLGLSDRVFITSPLTDPVAAKDTYHLYGPYAAIRHASDPNTTSGGYTRTLSNGDQFIMLKTEGKSEGEILTTLAHEIGHIVEKAHFKQADVDTRNAIIRAYNAWIDEHQPNLSKPGSAKDLIESMRHPLTADVQGVTSETPLANVNVAYWSSFSEWFADNTARWAMTHDKPKSVVEKFFKQVAETLRKLYAALNGKKYLPNKTLADYLDKLGPADFQVEAVKQPSNNGQIQKAQPHSVANLRGDKNAIQDQIREGLQKGERFSDEYTTYGIEDRSQVKGGGWVMVTKPLDGGYGSTKGGTGRGAWSQQEAADRVVQDMDYAITEASKNARISLDDMGQPFKKELLEKSREFRDNLREGWFTSDQLRAKLHVFISDYIWQKAPEHIDLDDATPSALAKDLIYQLHREVTPKPTHLPEATNDWKHNDRYVWEYATKLIDHGFDPEPFYEAKGDMGKVREAIRETIAAFKEPSGAPAHNGPVDAIDVNTVDLASLTPERLKAIAERKKGAAAIKSLAFRVKAPKKNWDPDALYQWIQDYRAELQDKLSQLDQLMETLVRDAKTDDSTFLKRQLRDALFRDRVIPKGKLVSLSSMDDLKSFARDVANIPPEAREVGIWLKEKFRQLQSPAQTFTPQDGEQWRKPSRATPRYGDLPEVKHTTKKGKELTGVIAKDLTKAQALEIDQGTFMKDGGWFLRKNRLDAYNERQQPEGTSHERTDDHPRDTEGAGSLPATEGTGDTGRHDVGVADTDQRGVSSRSGGSKKESTGQERHPGSDPVDAAGQPVSPGDRAGADHRGDTVPVRGENYRITENSLAIERSWPEKARDNIAAIRILRQLAKENRPARPDEQAILVRYVGWGASELANNIFPVSHRQLTPEWQTLADEVKALLTPEEWKNAARSVNYAHFTGAGIINKMYQAVQRFGVKTGLTFEAGTGIGHFMGLSPTDMNLHYTGVELDPVSARIAQALYPGNGTLQADFVRMGLPENHYDLTLGNPPYMNLEIKNDPKYGKMGFQIHDYFIAKQIDALKPGGIGAFITSSRTLDKQGQQFRQYVDGKANLIGAIRLPNTAFSQNAGAEVMTDILFFQKKGDGVPDSDNRWVALGDHPTLREDVTDSDGNTNRQPVQVNQYFLDNPHMILGNEGMGSSQYGEKYTVTPALTKRKGESSQDYLKRAEAQLQKDLNRAIKTLPRKLVKKNPSPEDIAKAAAKYDLNPKDKEDSFYIREDGAIGHVIDGVGQSVPIRGKGSYSGLSKAQQQYVRDYIPLREAVMAVYRSQTGSEADWKAAVAEMERQYDAFVKKHGPVNQGSYITQNRKDGKVIEILREPIISTLDMDPEAFRVAAIEDFDINTGEAKKTRIFTERILGIDPTPTIESAQDAVSHTLNSTGWLDMDTVQQHYPDHTLADIVSELGDEIYMDPATGRYVVKDAYLSGNVKAKLRDAEQAAKDNPALERNVRALKEVIPADLSVSQVPMRMGSFWIPESVVARFATEEMGLVEPEISKFRHREISSWKVNGFAMTSPFATSRVNATRMLAAALNQSEIVVKDKVWADGKETEITNSKESVIANAKKRELQEAFERWAKNNGEVADSLAKIYNRDFNTHVNRQHDGSHLTFPGMSSRIKLRPHQANVVWRIIQEGNTYMAHAVGAGKTMASIAAAMEMKRLGLVNKPTFAVLKSTLKQFAAEFLELYPNARILVADEKQLDAKNRRRFVAKMANENWDAVIMTHESFRSLPMSDEFIEQQIDQQIEELRDMLEDLDKSEGLTRKQIENRIGQLESKLGKMAEKATSRKDKGMSFEETGIDFLFIDEAHKHKKIGYPTRMGNLKGVESDTSARAQDLFMKTQYLESKRPGKHTVLMSGTPVSNTLGELFNIQRYLQPKALERNQVSSFDGWVSNFATTVSNIEMQADGGFKEVSRLAKFVGVPGLMRDVLQIMDYVGMEQMREKGLVKLPQVDKGIKVTERSEGLRAYQQELGERIKAYENLTGKEKRSKGVDAIVKILNDGRMAAIDMRMVNRTQEGPSKLEDMISNVFDHWQDTRSNIYKDKDGQPDKTTGGIQLIFSDAKRAYEFPGGPVTFDMFQYIKDSLVKRGIPADEIAFIHDYTNSVKKKRLFSDMNAGRKTILLGGSQDLGTGVNVQKRLTALHNLDINYVPAEMNQRLGRGERQGNQNPNVQNFLYVTEGTTDATVLQLNENKTRMSDQVMRGDFSIHEMEDVSTAGDELAQAKAIASGNPLLMEQAGVMAQYRQLAAQRDDHIDKMARYRSNLNTTTEVLAGYERALPEQEAMAKRYVSTRGDQFRATVNGKTYDKRADFGERMLSQIEGSLTDKSPKPRKVAEIAGYDLFARYNPTTIKAELTFDPDNKDGLAVAFRDGDDPLAAGGITSRIENRAAELSDLPRRSRNTMDMLKEDIVRYKKALKEKFPYQEQLDKVKQRLDEIDRELSGKEDETADTETETETTGGGTVRRHNYKPWRQSAQKKPGTVREGWRKSGTGKPGGRKLRYKLAEKPTKPYQVKPSISKLVEETGLDVQVVATESDLPRHLRERLKTDQSEGRVKGVYDESNGSTWVVASAHENAAEAVKTALHEAVGHAGVQRVLGKALNTTLDQIYPSVPTAVRQQLQKAYAGVMAQQTATEQRRTIASEYLAHLAETNPKAHWVTKAIAAARSWLRKLFPRLKWSDGEIRTLLVKSKKAALAPSRRPLNQSIGQARYKFDAVLKLDQQKIDTLKHKARSAYDLVRRGALGGLGGRQITEVYSHLFQQLADKIGYSPLAHVDKLLQKMGGDRNNWVSEANGIDKTWERLVSKHPEADKLLSTVMHESTLYQVDPRKDYTPIKEDIATLQEIVNNATSDQQKDIFTKKLKKEQDRKEAHARLKKHWQELAKTEDAQKLFKEVERFYKRQRAATKSALNKRLDAINLDAHAKGTALKQLEGMFAQDIKHGPYFPLQRFGDYVIIAKDAEGNPYRAHYESKYARDMAKQELQQEGYDITYSGMRAEFDPTSLAGVGQFSAGLMKALESKRNQFIDDEAKTQFLSEVNQLALSLLPEMSAAKRGMHRKGVPGYHENARRVFDSVALTNANRLSRLNYGWQIEAELSRIKDSVGEENPDSTLSDHQRDVAMQVYNELRKRHTKIMNPDGNAFAAHLTNLGFFMYMGGSVGAGLVNMTQNLLIALPQLGAKHGFRKTAAAMAKVHKDIFAHGGKKPRDLNALLDDAWFNLEHAEGKIPTDEVALIKALVKDGTIETTQVATLAQNADADMLPEKIKRRDWLTKASRASGMFFHNAEIINRQVAALTAYRLMKEEGKTQDLAPNDKPTEATLDAVRSAVLDAHYDYSSYNRPRYFKNNWAKVFLLFKQYSQNTSYFLGRNFHQALKGETPEIKKQALWTLGSTLGMHGLFAGALGLPGVSVAMFIAGLAMGDEDDPVDPEVEFRKGMYNTMAGIFGEKNGKVIAHALSKGVFNAFTGVDVHSRTSVNDLWFRGSNYDMSARQEAMYYLTSAFAGPLPGLGINAWAGVDKMKKGDYWQGLEAMMPKFVRDGMRAIRYTREGAMDASGNPLVQDFSVGEIAMQGLGMGPSSLSEAYTAKNAYNRPKNEITARKSLLLTQLFQAKTPADKQEVMARIDRYNTVQKRRGKGWEWAIITPKTIRASMKNRKRRKEEAVPGVGYVPENQRARLGEIGFAAF